ncbi:MAG TPA: MYXO-CTERM sorting domain-containing protein, partial [Polyangiaceae bacterium]|nr:MYXO-CTERM sorting domain-containing protein [Polyangiaceae bacterium]
GGPGTISPYTGNFGALIDHCLSGSNYFGGTGTRIDFISYHNKALADAQSQLDVNVISGLLTAHPSLADTLFVNGEADTEVGWWSDLEFRATPWYASFIARQVRNGQVNVINGLGVKFRLANDNAFIGTWHNRTQFTWFGDESNFALIKKPAHNVFTMLSLLGDQQASTSADVVNGSAILGALASVRDTSQAAVLLYNYSTDTAATGTTDVALSVSNVPFSAGKIVEYRIDKDHGDTYALWQSQGSPATPSAVQLQELRDNQELPRLSISDLAGNSASANVSLPLGSVSLFLFAADPGTPPASVSNLSVRVYQGIVSGQEDVMLSWRHDGWTVKTFEVFFSATSDGTFERVNAPDLLAYAYTHQIAASGAGFYKVRAVDFWDRVGPFSDTIGLDGSVVPNPDEAVGGSGGTGGSGGVASTTGGSTSTGGAAAGGAPGSGGAPPATAGSGAASPAASSNGEGGGCGACATGRGPSSWGALSLLTLALGAFVRRRRMAGVDLDDSHDEHPSH